MWSLWLKNISSVQNMFIITCIPPPLAVLSRLVLKKSDWNLSNEEIWNWFGSCKGGWSSPPLWGEPLGSHYASLALAEHAITALSWGMGLDVGRLEVCRLQSEVPKWGQNLSSEGGERGRGWLLLRLRGRCFGFSTGVRDQIPSPHTVFLEHTMSSFLYVAGSGTYCIL